MSVASRSLNPALAIARRDFLVARSYRIRFITGLFSSFVTLTMFYYISRLVRVDGSLSPGEYFAFVTMGILIFEIVGATLTRPHVALRQELVAGTFERILLAPGGTMGGILGLLIFPALYTLLTVMALLCFAAIVFGVELNWSTVPLGIPVAVLAILAFAPFGLLLQASVIIGKMTPPGAGYIPIAISLVAGLYFPIALLPDWIQWASEVQPFTPAVELLRWALVGQSPADPVWLAVTKLLGFAAVALPISIAAISAALRVSRRRGTILEY